MMNTKFSSLCVLLAISANGMELSGNKRGSTSCLNIARKEVSPNKTSEWVRQCLKDLKPKKKSWRGVDLKAEALERQPQKLSWLAWAKETIARILWR